MILINIGKQIINYVKTFEFARSIAAPQECYKDNRIQSIAEAIDILGKHLSTNKKDHFYELISRVIDTFNGQYNLKPNPLSIY